MSGTMAVLQGLLLLGMLGMGVLVLTLKDLMASAVALAAFSLMMALEFLLLQAPDVAIAEAGIGAGLTTAILVMGIRTVQKREARAGAAKSAAGAEKGAAE